MDFPNATVSFPSGVYRQQEVLYKTVSVHAIDGVDIFFAVTGYVILVYFWIKVNKNKEYYTAWKNPRGRVVNLYKIIKTMMIIYPIAVVILGVLQILLFAR